MSVLIFLGHFCFGQIAIDEPFAMVKLHKDSTHIVLEDYFPNIKETAYRVTHEPEGMDVRVLNNYEIVLYGEPTHLIDYLGISVDFIERGIPLQKYLETDSIHKKKNFITTQSFSPEKGLQIFRSYTPTKLLAFINNRPIAPEQFTFKGQEVFMKIPEFVSNFSMANLRVYGFDFNQTTNDIWVPLSYGKPVENAEVLTRSNDHSNVFYSLLIDRFSNGNGLNDAPFNVLELSPNKDWMGGDFKGIGNLIDQNYFKQMGCNSLILSPIFKNENQFQYKDSVLNAPYLGDKPVSYQKIEPRFGTDQDFQRIIGKAHLKKMNIFLSIPEKTLMKAVQNIENEIDSLTYVFDLYPIDGYMYLNTESIQKTFWTKLSKNINKKVAVPQGRQFFQLGSSEKGLPNNKIKGLDTQFDLELLHLGRSVFYQGKPISSLSTKLEERIHTFGSHHLLANVSGNVHMKRNFTIAKANDENEFATYWKKMKQFFVFNLTIPGVPVLFYGDEIGLESEDENNHPFMRFSNLDNTEKEFRNFIAGLNKLRTNQMALMYGETEIIESSPHTLIYARSYLNNKIIIVYNTSNVPQNYSVTLPDYLKDSIFLPRFFTPVEKMYRKLIFTLPAYGFEIFIGQ